MTPRRSRNTRDTAGVTVENVNHPGTSRVVDAAMYDAMRRAMLKVLPRANPGLTLEQVRKAILPLLSSELYPGGTKAGWWLKTVQLDLEAKKLIARDQASPLRLRRL